MDDMTREMLTEILEVSRETKAKVDGVEVQVRTIAGQVDRHEMSLFGRGDERDGLLARVGRIDERISGRFSLLESDIRRAQEDLKRVYAVGGFVLAAVGAYIIGQLLNLI